MLITCLEVGENGGDKKVPLAFAYITKQNTSRRRLTEHM